MDWSILNAEPHPIPLHAYSAMFALVVGTLQWFTRKGSTVHVATGYTWVISMLIVCISSFWIHEIKTYGNYSPIHLLTLWTLFSLAIAIYRARQHRIQSHKSWMINLYVFALIITGGFTFLPGRTMHAVFWPGGIMYKVLFQPY